MGQTAGKAREMVDEGSNIPCIAPCLFALKQLVQERVRLRGKVLDDICQLVCRAFPHFLLYLPPKRVTVHLPRPTSIRYGGNSVLRDDWREGVLVCDLDCEAGMESGAASFQRLGPWCRWSVDKVQFRRVQLDTEIHDGLNIAHLRRSYSFGVEIS
jgi:hypothetical protein